jgi:hypothetical protein
MSGGGTGLGIRTDRRGTIFVITATRRLAGDVPIFALLSRFENIATAATAQEE